MKFRECYGLLGANLPKVVLDLVLICHVTDFIKGKRQSNLATKNSIIFKKQLIVDLLDRGINSKHF